MKLKESKKDKDSIHNIIKPIVEDVAKHYQDLNENKLKTALSYGHNEYMKHSQMLVAESKT